MTYAVRTMPTVPLVGACRRSPCPSGPSSSSSTASRRSPSAAPRRRMAEGGPKGRPDKPKEAAGPRGRARPKGGSAAGTGSRAAWRSCATRRSSGASTGAWCSPPPRSLVLGVAGIVDRLRVAEAPADVHNENAVFKPAEAEKGGEEDGQLADLRLRPGAHPLPAGERREAALPRSSGATRSHPLLEFPPILAGGKLYLVNNSGFAVSLDADTGKAALEAADRHPQRLLAGLLPAPPLHRQPGPRPHRQARREDRQDDLETTRCRAGPSPRRW